MSLDYTTNGSANKVGIFLCVTWVISTCYLLWNYGILKCIDYTFIQISKERSLYKTMYSILNLRNFFLKIMFILHSFSQPLSSEPKPLGKDVWSHSRVSFASVSTLPCYMFLSIYSYLLFSYMLIFFWPIVCIKSCKIFNSHFFFWKI